MFTISNTDAAARAVRRGLADLSWVELEGGFREAEAAAPMQCTGGPVWRRRKLAEYREFLALCQISDGRLVPLRSDLGGPLALAFQMRAPVPTLPDPAGDLVVRDRALLGLVYREEALREPQPGSSFVVILAPNNIYHPNVTPAEPGFGDFGPGQSLCLGAKFAPGSITVKELILRSYAALTLQSVQLDPGDSAGLFNPGAAQWWIANRQRMPLTTEGLIPRIQTPTAPQP